MKTWRFLAIILGALALGMSYAHVLELPAKMQLTQLTAWQWTALNQTLYLAFGPIGGSGEVAAVLIAAVLAYRTRGREPLTLTGALLGACPLIVLSSTAGAPSPDAAARARALQADLATLSTDGVHLEVPGATHAGLVHDPQHARITSEAILRVVEAVRAGRRLNPQ